MNHSSSSPRLPFLILISILVILAFSFQGNRGIWEPDEGFYIGISRNMVETGDWVVPQMNLRPYLDKPPLVYWGSALAMKIFGFNEWAARLAHALWFILTALVVRAIGKSLWDVRTGNLAALIYAASPVPFVAAHIVTPDTPLTFWTTISMFAFWRCTTSKSVLADFGWKVLLGVGLGMAVLSKGPATFVFMAPMFVYLLVQKSLKQFLFQWGTVVSALLFVGIGGAWYAAVIYFTPGAAAYFFDNQILGRLVTEKYNRNPEWYAFLYVYFPVLLFGTLPWSVGWYPVIARKLKSDGNSPDALSWIRDPKVSFLALLTFVPLIIFSLASSRLPLYVLPLFVPLSLASARCWFLWKPRWFGGGLPRLAPAAIGSWLLLMLAVKGGLAYWPTDRDTRAYWNGIKDHVPDSRYELVVVNQRRHGLSFYTGGGVEWVTTKEHPYPTFYETESLEHETHELPTSSHHHIFLVREKEYESAKRLIHARGLTFQEHPAPFDTRMLVCRPAPNEDWVVRLAAMGDTRSGDTGQAQLGSALYYVDEERPLDGIVLLGDNVSYDGDPDAFPDTFQKPYNALLDAGVKFFATLGNHDVKGGHVDFQLNHPLLNMRGHRYYTKVFGENLVQVFFLDTNTLIADPKQFTWLIQELKKSETPWKVVAMHVPIYGRIERRPEADLNLRARLEPVFIEHGVDIVLSGHNHVYQRLRPQNGIHYFTAGSGGKIDRGQILPDDPDLLVGNDERNVAILLQFTEGTCEFKAIDSLERIVDEGTIPYPEHTAVSYPI